MMHTTAQVDERSGSGRIRGGRPLPSLRQRYQQYLLQRIEDYKNSLSREELLRIGDDAVAELLDNPEGQYSLTEVLTEDAVDSLIEKRLGLPSFTRWRQKFSKLRQAQREPTHWGLERRSALTAVLQRIEAGDHALVIGGESEAAVYLLAAHDVRLTCLFEDNATCTRIENRMGAESLTGNFEPLVVMLGSWFPDVPLPVHLVVIGAGVLAELPAPRRLSLMAWLQDRTTPGGLHAVISQAGSIAAEAWLSLYPDWERVPLRPESTRRAGGGRGGSGAPGKQGAPTGVLLARPVPPVGSPQQVSSA